MKTDDLIAALARAAAPADPAAARRRFSLTLCLGVLLSLAAMLALLGPRHDWRSALELPMFWIKLAFPAATATAAFVVLRRLGHPGLRLGWSAVALAIPVACVWLMAAAVLAAAQSGDRLSLVTGSSAAQCPLSIAALSLPAFALAVGGVRQLAPTRLVLTGSLAGLFAGAAAAFAYAMHCSEMQAPFLAVWYVLGMLVPAAAGAALGRRLLRW